MRLFVAAQLPQEMLEALSETSALLRASVQGRYVGPDLFHVTLAFLGELPGSEVSRLSQAIGEACATQAAFVTTLGALGTFGRARSAVLWQGFCEGQDAWDSLAASVRSSLDAYGYRYDAKGFLPHVTLMRRADVSRG
ncbi:MAG: RNA 2',3'-cyclic phosphodiesterase, partial [Coriobacteriales bacterium]|nr:RNA 2',3'-cyclic phosphodiesterase [Coriobacteriales bacterium]